MDYSQPGYNAPYPAQPPPQYVASAPTTFVTTGQPTVVTAGPSGVVTAVNTRPVLSTKLPTPTQCPYCHQHVTTIPSAETGTLTWVAVGAILLFGFWLGCCLIPFCIDDLKDVHHSCPNCNRTIYVWRRM